MEYLLFLVEFAALTALLFLYQRLQARLSEVESAVERAESSRPGDTEESLRELIAELNQTAEQIAASLSERSRRLEELIGEADVRLAPAVEEILVARGLFPRSDAEDEEPAFRSGQVHLSADVSPLEEGPPLGPRASSLVPWPFRERPDMRVEGGAAVGKPGDEGGRSRSSGKGCQARRLAEATAEHPAPMEKVPSAAEDSGEACRQEAAQEDASRGHLRLLSGGEGAEGERRAAALRLIEEGWGSLEIARQVHLGREEVELLRGLYESLTPGSRVEGNESNGA